jgi:sialate O-acetylesterase
MQRRALLDLLLLVIFSTIGRAEVSMPAIFGDHMVLQQGTSLPIWGRADPGEQVTVQFVGQKVTTTARYDGVWRVNLQPVYLRSSPDILMIDGKNHLEFSDVLVGEVWLCSGGSNMALPLREADGATSAIDHAEDEQLRFFVVPEQRACQPQYELRGRWERALPESAATFSAVGYFFGRDLRMATGMPIGLIGSYCSGSTAQAWISLSALEQSPSFSNYVAQYHHMVHDFSKNREIYQQQKAIYERELDVWEREVGLPYQEELAIWRVQCQEACSKLWAQPQRPEPSSPKPIPPLSPDGGPRVPTMLFNGMIAPLIPYALTGLIWYQGESNENGRLFSEPIKQNSYSWSALQPISPAFEYRRLFQRLIRSWRVAWGEGPLPFYFVSLTGFHQSTSDPIDRLLDQEGRWNPGWAWLREGQALMLSLPETQMAVATDLGDPDTIHPKDKLDVGRRLALLAREHLYGQKVRGTSPTYRSMKQEGSTLQLTFDHVGDGLTVAAPPGRYDVITVFPHSLQGFAIAGDDRHWYQATALIQGDCITLSSPLVKKPTAARYNWKDDPTGNLYSREGLPAGAFRTDLDQPK